MTKIPPGVLFETPRNLPERAKTVFGVFQGPALIAYSLVTNPDLDKIELNDLADCTARLRDRLTLVNETLDELDGIAPQTWEKGFAIRNTVWKVYSALDVYCDMVAIQPGNPIGLPPLDAKGKEWHLQNFKTRMTEARQQFNLQTLMGEFRLALANERHQLEPEKSESASAANATPITPGLAASTQQPLEVISAVMHAIPQLSQAYIRLVSAVANDDAPATDAAAGGYKRESEFLMPNDLRSIDSLRFEMMREFAANGIPQTDYDPILNQIVETLGRLVWMNRTLPGIRRLVQETNGAPGMPALRVAHETNETIDGVNEFLARRGLGLVTDPQPTEPATSEPATPAGSGRGIPLAEAEIRVREWLAANAKDNPTAITRDSVASGTGVSSGQVSNTSAWKAFRDRRDAEAKPGARNIPLTRKIKATIPAGDVGKAQSEQQNAIPDEVAALIDEQKADEAEQEVRHTLRHGPS